MQAYGLRDAKDHEGGSKGIEPSAGSADFGTLPQENLPGNDTFRGTRTFPGERDVPGGTRVPGNEGVGEHVRTKSRSGSRSPVKLRIVDPHRTKKTCFFCRIVF